MTDDINVDGYEVTDDDRDEAESLAARFMNGPLRQLVRAEAMNQLSQAARTDPENRDAYEALFEEIRQEALDAEGSARRALGIRGRVRAWYRTHCHRPARGALQRLSRLVRSVAASLPRL